MAICFPPWPNWHVNCCRDRQNQKEVYLRTVLCPALKSRRPDMKRLCAVSVILLIAILPRSSTGQQSDPSQAKGQAPLQHEVTVALKLVQVYVTDKKGNPIPDLRKDEFVLFDNKEEKTITEFENHTLSLPGNERKPVTPTPTPLEKAPAPPAPLMSRTFFFLFDLVFADQGGFRLGRQAAIRYLETSVKPDDQIAVLSFTGGRSLNVLHRPDGGQAEPSERSRPCGLDSLAPIAPTPSRRRGSAAGHDLDDAYSSFPPQPTPGDRMK